MDKDRPADKNYVTGVGQLNITVKENNLADISLTDIEMKIIEFSQDETPKDTMTHNAPTTVVQDMKTNGSFEDSNTEVLFDFLFPLPNKNILDGKSDEISMKMPFNANGSILFSKGQNKLTFLEFKEIEGRKCVVFKGDINISELEVPAELKGNYKYTTIGNATYYFDLENGYYVGADVKMVMDVLMDTETHKYDESGMYMETTSESVYKIRLKKIEE